MEFRYTLTLEQLNNVSLTEFLRLVLEQNRRLEVRMPDGDVLIVQPEAGLIPLPELEGYVPDGWKDAIYAQ
ncbi:MAG: hypothetical protein ABIG63_04645 [Chloroflexota bacterium]